MDIKTILNVLVIFLHNLFTVIWVGGLIVLAITVMPSVKQVLGMGPQTKKLMGIIQKRQSFMVYVSILGLILTGLFQAKNATDFGGLFSFANPYSTVLTSKHILMLIMISIALIRTLVLSRDTQKPSQEKLKIGLMYLNASLGILVLLLSGFSTVL